MEGAREGSAAESIVVSVVVPVRDEEASIGALAAEVTAALGPTEREWECIWVDDGSTDGTIGVLEELEAAEPRHRYLSFVENAGQSAALQAGFRAARGRYVATIDGDGQNDPADLPRLLSMLETGDVDMVNGYRARRQDSWVRKVSSRIGNSTRNLLTGRTVRDVGCSTRAFRRECVDQLPIFRGCHRFLPTLVALRGFRIGEVAVHHRPRERGRSKYGIHNRLWVGIVDCLGVAWLRTRGYRYRVRVDSSAGAEGTEGAMEG